MKIDLEKFRKEMYAFLETSPVRKEQTGERNLDFSDWIRQHCRPSKPGFTFESRELGCLVFYDIDFVIFDYERRMLQVIELKTHYGKIRWAQRTTFDEIDKILSYGSADANVTYLGLHYLVLDGTFPGNSKYFEWDGKQITKEECWRKINMLDEIQ